MKKRYEQYKIVVIDILNSDPKNVGLSVWGEC